MKLMELNELITSTGHTLKRKTANEWAGACPFCGGNDRFIVTPEKDLYWCRQCHKTGDAIQFLIDVKHLTFKEAALQLGRDTTKAWQPLQRKAEAKPTWTPRTTTAPGELWQEAAQAFLEQTQRTLWHDQGKHARAWLHNRGLNDSTIKQAALGWNTTTVYHDRAAWGLEPFKNDQGRDVINMTLPTGLLIPLKEGGQVIRLRIRRPEEGIDQRYKIITGSDTRPMTWNMHHKAVVIVESELDGLLIHQQAGDVVGVIALGSAQARPDMATHEALKQASIILLALDTDKAGAKASWQWWAKQYRQARRWPCINGKDPSEAFKNGLDIRTWTLAGLGIRDTVIKPFPKEWLMKFDYDTLERLAIMTVDAGMTDAQALAALTTKPQGLRGNLGLLNPAHMPKQGANNTGDKLSIAY